jgi:hypothetical protein
MASWQEPARASDAGGEELLMTSCNRWAFFCRPKFDNWQDFASEILRQLRAAEVIVQIQELPFC